MCSESGYGAHMDDVLINRTAHDKQVARTGGS
jgi:hypothetical protein